MKFEGKTYRVFQSKRGYNVTDWEVIRCIEPDGKDYGMFGDVMASHIRSRSLARDIANLLNNKEKRGDKQKKTQQTRVQEKDENRVGAENIEVSAG